LTEKSGPHVTNNERLILILVDPVDDEEVEEIVHKLILQTSDNAIFIVFIPTIKLVPIALLYQIKLSDV
jgi:hypothetical protein